MTVKSNSLISKLSQPLGVIWRTMTSTKYDLVILNLVVTSLLLGIRQLGWLQPLELAAFDLMVRFRPDQGPDPRLLVVGITEQDIKNLKQYPISDQVLAKALGEVERHQPRAIGVDLARNVPVEPGYAQLAAQFKNPKLIAITYIGNTASESTPPPPNLPEERIGFSDALLDPDGVTRRNSMYAVTESTKILYSFSLRLTLAYLKQEGILPHLTHTGDVQLGQAVFQRLIANSGGYQTIDDGDYQILLNYRSAQNIARQVSLTQVLQGQFDPKWVKDKIVLVGPVAPTVHDVFYTPYSSTEKGNPQMPGVLLHAQMVSQLLGAVLDHRPLFWFWPEWVEVGWIVGWSLIGGMLVVRLQNPLVLGISSLAGVSVLWGSTWLMFLQAGWIPLAAPTITAVATGMVVEIYQRQQAKRQEQIVMRLLGQQTSPEIAKTLWDERDLLLKSGILPGQRLIVTVLLTDLKNFSSISEKLPPETVMAWLNEYLPVMVEEVQNHHGVINKFTGDGVLAVFGVPVPATCEADIAKDAQNAVACALAMSERLHKLNLSWFASGLPVVQMRVGIFTGPAMVGSLGGKDRLEYGVIGDSVNTASRLESCEKDRQPSDCRILIAKETLIHLREKFEVESWGFLQMKGKQQKIDVYRVIGRLPKSQSISC